MDDSESPSPKASGRGPKEWEIQLISKVKEHSHLYDSTQNHYKDPRICIQTWIDIARQLGMPGEWRVCKERWRTLRDVYVRNRKCYLLGGFGARKRPKWAFFDLMDDFLHSYINHKALEADKTGDSSVLWNEGKRQDMTSSDSDCSDAPSPQPQPWHRRTSSASPTLRVPILGVKVKQEPPDEEDDAEVNMSSEPDESKDQCAKRKRRKQSAVDELEALLLQEADPLYVCVDGQPIKQEVEWAEEEVDMEEKYTVKPSPSPSPSSPSHVHPSVSKSPPPTPSTPSPSPPPPPPPPDDKKTRKFNILLPGGKSMPASIITTPSNNSFTKTIRVAKQHSTNLKSVPIKIKTVTGIKGTLPPPHSSSTLPSPPQQPQQPPQQPPPQPKPEPKPPQLVTPVLKKEERDRDPVTPRTSMSPTRTSENPHKTARHNGREQNTIEDEEELFSRYVAASMRKLSSRCKSLAKLRIQEALYHVEELDRVSGENRRGRRNSSWAE